MTPEEFATAMEKVIDQGGEDWEAIHSRADELMEAVLLDLGYGEGINLLAQATRWYA